MIPKTISNKLNTVAKTGRSIQTLDNCILQPFALLSGNHVHALTILKLLITRHHNLIALLQATIDFSLIFNDVTLLNILLLHRFIFSLIVGTIVVITTAGKTPFISVGAASLVMLL